MESSEYRQLMDKLNLTHYQELEKAENLCANAHKRVDEDFNATAYALTKTFVKAMVELRDKYS